MPLSWLAAHYWNVRDADAPLSITAATELIGGVYCKTEHYRQMVHLKKPICLITVSNDDDLRSHSLGLCTGRWFTGSVGSGHLVGTGQRELLKILQAIQNNCDFICAGFDQTLSPYPAS